MIHTPVEQAPSHLLPPPLRVPGVKQPDLEGPKSPWSDRSITCIKIIYAPSYKVFNSSRHHPFQSILLHRELFLKYLCGPHGKITPVSKLRNGKALRGGVDPRVNRHECGWGQQGERGGWDDCR